MERAEEGLGGGVGASSRAGRGGTGGGGVGRQKGKLVGYLQGN